MGTTEYKQIRLLDHGKKLTKSSKKGHNQKAKS